MRILDDAVRQATWDLAAQQEAWIVEQAHLLGITVEELAEDYYLEVENLGPELTPVPEGDAVICSARSRSRLRRRDDQARMNVRPEEARERKSNPYVRTSPDTRPEEER